MDKEKMDVRELTEKELGHHELTDEELAQVSGGRSKESIPITGDFYASSQGDTGVVKVNPNMVKVC